jgi:hypothetical protein
MIGRAAWVRPRLSESSRARITDRVHGAAKSSRRHGCRSKLLLGVFRVDIPTSKQRWNASAVGSYPGPEFDRARAAAMGLPFEAPELAVARASPDGGDGCLGA